jgi:hypothetical protein
LPKYKSRENATDIELNIRCDSCSARAKYLVLLKAGRLFFCGHHLKKNMSSLEALPTKKSIVDMETKLEIER